MTTVGPTTATVSGAVNPNGTSTAWHVEYGTSTSYGTSTATKDAGSGTSSVAISADLTGLKVGTTYHYRVVATSTGGTAHGNDGILTTSSAPDATTGNASGIGTTSATLNGTVNPNGRPTSWLFEYGTSTKYGSKTPTKDAGFGTSPVAVSAQLTGLTTGKLYHYRLVATSDAGAKDGADQTFTPTAAPTVTTKSASSVGDTGAKLNGAVDPHGASTTAFFEYGTSASYGSKTSSQNVGSGTGATNVSATLTGLAPGTTYHVRLVASNASGASNGSDQTFTTTGPPVPKTGTPTAVTTSGATLVGTVDPAGHSTTWYFEYGTTLAYGTKTASHGAGSGNPVTVTTSISGLNPAVAYHVRLVASNSAGTRQGPDVVFTTAGPPVTVSAAARSVVAGHAVLLSGKLSNKQENATVTVFSQPYGAGSFAARATVLTGPGGTWSLSVKPRIATVYKALWNGQPSATVAISVRPAVSLHALSKGRFSAHVSAARSFRGRVVQLQRRLLDGRWLTIARVRLNLRSTAVFHPALPKGRSLLRVAMSVNQAGAGYLAGFSTELGYRRR